MAYDPEARRESKSALTLGFVTLGLLGAGALAYLLTRPADTPPTAVVVGGPTRVLEKTKVVDRPVPVGQPQVIVQGSAPNASGLPVTNAQNSGTQTVVTRPSVVTVRPGVPSAAAPPVSSTTTTSSTTVTNNARTGVAAPAPASSAPARSIVNNTTVNVAPPRDSASDISKGTTTRVATPPNGSVDTNGNSTTSPNGTP